jgi:hypothetical protein
MNKLAISILDFFLEDVAKVSINFFSDHPRQ